MEFFISYSSKDKELASKIGEMLSQKYSVFLAHRDISMSKEWRDDILSHLESCSVLIAVCTSNYANSAWGNQEAGIAIEKGRKVIPLFAQGTNKSRFGFLEAKQGHPHEFTEQNLKNIVNDVIKAVTP